MYNSWAVGNRLNCELPLYWSYLKESAGRRYRFCLRCKNPRRLSCSTTLHLVHAIYSQSWLCHTLFPFHLYPVGNSFVKLVVVLHKLAKLLLLLLLLFFFLFNHAEFNLHSGTKSAPLGKNSHVGHNFSPGSVHLFIKLIYFGSQLVVWCVFMYICEQNYWCVCVCEADNWVDYQCVLCDEILRWTLFWFICT